MSDSASYTQVTGELDCNKCVWGTRDGGCASWECEFIDRDDAVKAWRNIPSAESEIIRCKDCKYAHLTYSGDCKFCDKWTDEFGIPEEVYLDGAFYCGFAKRREDE